MKNILLYGKAIAIFLVINGLFKFFAVGVVSLTTITETIKPEFVTEVLTIVANNDSMFLVISFFVKLFLSLVTGLYFILTFQGKTERINAFKVLAFFYLAVLVLYAGFLVNQIDHPGLYVYGFIIACLADMAALIFLWSFLFSRKEVPLVGLKDLFGSSIFFGILRKSILTIALLVFFYGLDLGTIYIISSLPFGGSGFWIFLVSIIVFYILLSIFQSLALGIAWLFRFILPKVIPLASMVIFASTISGINLVYFIWTIDMPHKFVDYYLLFISTLFIIQAHALVIAGAVAPFEDTDSK